jgi:pimeloyl-ACP methyl ester carboxylesterase/ketosteroid isomerase-like protein
MQALLTILLLANLDKPDPADAVRQAEMGFAKAFADRDMEKFISYVADDATFMSGRGTLRGKQQVKEGWAGLFKNPEPPFSWGPERAYVSGEGKLGVSWGPLYDRQGKLAGYYTSTWRREPDGTWKVVFDGPGASAFYKAEDAPKIEEGFVTTEDGVRLFYRKTGASPLTLIIPGDLFMFDDFRQLAEMATVITYDPRNRGRSTRSADTATWTIQQDAKDLETVRSHFKVEKFVPIGFSYLGKMVILYAQDHPERVTRIVQIGPVEMTTDAQKSARRMIDWTALGVPAAELQKMKEATERGDMTKAPREFCDVQWNVLRYMLVGNRARVNLVDTTFCQFENEWPVNFTAHITKVFESMKAAPLAKKDVANVTVPVLTIHGTEDRNAPYEGGKEWAASLPDARLLTLRGAAHRSWIDDPVVVFGSVREFLRGNWPYGAEKILRSGSQ